MQRICFILCVTFGMHAFALSQTFDIDKGHTFISFEVNRFAMVNVQGRFNDFSGTITYDSTQQSIESTHFQIDVRSLDTGHDVRDGHLLGAIWLNADEHPTIEFSSTSIQRKENGFIATGDLTIRGMTQVITFPFEQTGPMVDPTKQNTMGISASLTINRQDYGISFSRQMDNGRLFIGNDVHIEIHALAVVPKD